MTLDEWRSNPKLASWAGQVFNSASGRQFLQMLKDCHPCYNQLPMNGDDSVKATELGRIYGYSLALNNIEAAVKFDQPAPIIQETFGFVEVAPEPVKPSKR